MFKIEKVVGIDVKELQEWGDNPIKRKDVPDEELRQSIKDYGLTVDTIAVVPNGKGYIVVDGNRRLRIARELGINGKFLAKIYSKDTDVVSLAIKLNGVGRAWDRQSYTQFVVGHPERINLLPKRYKQSTRRMHELLKGDYEWFVSNCKPNAFDWGVLLADYVGRGDDEAFVKKTVLWTGKHKLVREVRKAREGLASKKMIEKAILQDRPLRFNLTVGK